MTKKEIIQQVKQEMASRRHLAQVRCENFIEKLKKDEEFKTLYIAYNIANLNLVKAKYSFKDSPENMQKVSDEFLNAKANLEKYLKSKNISPKKLNPQYQCKLCEDKGIVNGKMCKCLSDEINLRLSNNLSTYNKFHTFNMINSNKMTENTTLIFKEIYNWCESFPNNIININLLGDVGTGKTFLLECVTSRLIEKGVNALFLTAFDFNEECRKYHTNQPNSLDNIMSCDALIIDDLGTEPVLKNVTAEYLYNVVNLRQTKGKATLISTNLDFSAIMNRYGERTFSRLVNKAVAKSYLFLGKDNRAK